APRLPAAAPARRAAPFGLLTGAGVSSAAAGRGDERVEQGLVGRVGVGGVLRVPLHGEEPPGRVLQLDRLDRAVLREGGGYQAGARLGDALVVVAGGVDLLGAGHLRQQ